MPPRHRLTKDQVKTVRRLWREGVSQQEIARAVGVPFDRFRARLRDQLHGLPPRPRRVNSGRRVSDPTESEIEAECLAIRSKWSDAEREAHL